MVVGGGHDQHTRELKLEPGGGALDGREEVGRSLVAAVDIGVLQQPAPLRLRIPLAQARQRVGDPRCLVLRLGSHRAVIAEVEHPQPAFALKLFEDVEVGHAAVVEAVVGQAVVGQELGPFELVPLPGVDRVVVLLAPLGLIGQRLSRRVIMGAESDRQRHRRAVRQREGVDRQPEVELKRRLPADGDFDGAAIVPRSLVLGRGEAEPEGLGIALGDVGGGHEVENRVGPPADVGRAVRRHRLRLDIAHRHGLDRGGRKRGATGPGQVGDPDRHLPQAALQRHDHQLRTFALVACQGNVDPLGRRDRDRHVARQHLDHRVGQPDRGPVAEPAAAHARPDLLEPDPERDEGVQPSQQAIDPVDLPLGLEDPRIAILRQLAEFVDPDGDGFDLFGDPGLVSGWPAACRLSRSRASFRRGAELVDARLQQAGELAEVALRHRGRRLVLGQERQSIEVERHVAGHVGGVEVQRADVLGVDLARCEAG